MNDNHNNIIWNKTFDYLISKLENQYVNNLSKNDNISNKFKVFLHEELIENLKLKITNYKQLCHTLIYNNTSSLLTLLNHQKLIEYKYEQLLIDIDKYHDIVLFRLHQQVNTTIKRIKDLVIEVLNEYNKCCIQLESRNKFIELNKNHNILINIYKLRWERFTHRLIFDLNYRNINQNHISYQQLLPTVNHSDYKFISDKLLLLNSQISDLSLYCITYACKLTLNNKSLINDNNITHVNPSSLKDIYKVLLLWSNNNYNADTTRPNQANSPRRHSSKLSNASKLSYYLCYKYIEWIHPISFNHVHWDSMYNDISNNTLFYRRYKHQHLSRVYNDKLYYCIEERFYSMKENDINIPFDNLALNIIDSNIFKLQEFIQNKYRNIDIANDNGNNKLQYIRKLLESVIQVIENKVFIDENNDLIDIVEGKCIDGTTLHFAKAYVCNLPETSAYQRMDLNSDDIRKVLNTCPHPLLPTLSYSNSPVILNQLYTIMCLHADSNDQTNSNDMIMFPLVDECIYELFFEYIWPKDLNSENIESVNASLSRPNSRQRSITKLSTDNTENVIESDHINRYKNDFRCLLPTDFIVRNSKYSNIDNNTVKDRYVLLIPSENVSQDIHNSLRKPNNKRIDKHSEFNNNSFYYLVEIQPFPNRNIFDKSIYQILLDNNICYLLNRNAVNKLVDFNIYSHTCNWRGCINNILSNNLCSYHNKLKYFVDNQANKFDSINYLSNSIKSNSINTSSLDNDVTVYSILIQELKNGKLKATVNNFIDNIMNNMNNKNYLINFINKSVNRLVKQFNGKQSKHAIIQYINPYFIIYKNSDYLIKLIDLLNNNQQLLKNILSIEKLIYNEMSNLLMINVNPINEIVSIKKEMKSIHSLISTNLINSNEFYDSYVKNHDTKRFDSLISMNEIIDNNLLYYNQYNNTLSSEFNLYTKKLNLLKNKYINSNNYIIYKNKQYNKLKEIEEIQSKDPKNFQNQSKY